MATQVNYDTIIKRLTAIKFSNDEIFKSDGKYVDTNYTKIGYNEGLNQAIAIIKQVKEEHDTKS